MLRVTNATGTRARSLSKKRIYSLEPVSPVYSSCILEIEDRRVGYFNLRTFIDSADDQM
ncbi:MAG: peptidase S41, partial [Gammaproteobacteria bacterium]|nr:peptidase S41 [Gammaproteobacteria bacterium]